MSEEREFNHWFWNGPLVNWVAQMVVDFDGWLFKKQCGE